MIRISILLLFVFYSSNSYSTVSAISETGSLEPPIHTLVCPTVESCPSFMLDKISGLESDSFYWVPTPNPAVDIDEHSKVFFLQWDVYFVSTGTKFTTKNVKYNYTETIEPVACSNSDECFIDAQEKCILIGEILKDFEYISGSKYTHSCSVATNPADACKNKKIQQCANNRGLASFIYNDNGQGTTTCTGVCGDGSIAEDKPDCTVYPFCDVPDENSYLDFSGGSSGSDVLPPSSSSADTEHEIPYEPDGTTSNNETSFSTLQGDKLINEVVKNRNDNSEKLIDTTKTTNETIVEKSDDISKTVSNSANGIIDAIKGIRGDSTTPDNSGVISAVDSLGDKIDSIGDGALYDNNGVDMSSWGDSAFGAIQIEEYQRKITEIKEEIKTSNSDFQSSLKANVNLVNNANGYQANNLDIGKWGSHDISISRFSDFFGGVGNIIYFLASLTALSIVLAGIRL